MALPRNQGIYLWEFPKSSFPRPAICAENFLSQFIDILQPRQPFRGAMAGSTRCRKLISNRNKQLLQVTTHFFREMSTGQWQFKSGVGWGFGSKRKSILTNDHPSWKRDSNDHMSIMRAKLNRAIIIRACSPYIISLFSAHTFVFHNLSPPRQFDQLKQVELKSRLLSTSSWMTVTMTVIDLRPRLLLLRVFSL